jgi:hypothetical protein
LKINPIISYGCRYLKNIMDFQGARVKAEQLAMHELQACGVSADGAVLGGETLEAEGCWIFFLSGPALDRMRTHPGRLAFTAFAVSKAGETASVYDFREQPEKMNAYLQLWSLHALGRKAEAKMALDSFMEKYASDAGTP